MFQLYSRACEYALRALVAAGARGVDRFRVAEVCAWTDIPEPYTRKVLQSLARSGFLRAERGPGGGYSLSKAPSTISILDIVKAVDGADVFDHCIMGLPTCGSENPCPLHETWSEAKSDLVNQLERLNLQDAIDAAERQRDGE